MESASGRTIDSPYADDAPPTLVMDSPRVTNASAYASHLPATRQGNEMRSQYGTDQITGGQNTMLPTISLALAVSSCFLVCCSGGIWLGLPAAVVGFLGLRNAENDPARYGGRGLAVAGMVIGIVTFLSSLVFLLFGFLSG